MASPIPITVLGGYLGAGKTTLLNRVLAGTDQRLGVVVNDFGALGVDAALLRGATGEDGLIDLPNGCVCCTLGNDLGVALEAFAARRPRLDQIVIEASGVADPAALAAWGTVPGFAPGAVIVLAAADTIRRQADDRYVGGEVRRQLGAGDLVLVTKGDLVGDAALATVCTWIRTVAEAVVVPSPGPGGDARTIADLVLAPSPFGSDPKGNGGTALPFGSDPKGNGGDRAHDTVYVRWSWRPAASGVTTAHVERFVNDLPETVLRAKGIVGGTEIQVVGARRSVIDRVGAIDLGPAVGPREGVVAIGVADVLDLAELDALAERHLGVGRSGGRDGR